MRQQKPLTRFDLQRHELAIWQIDFLCLNSTFYCVLNFLLNAAFHRIDGSLRRQVNELNGLSLTAIRFN